MNSILQTDSWVETAEDCDGPKRIRNSPSRENPGILMNEIQNKYITEFELPYRNVSRYIKEIGNDWNRLDNQQRIEVKKAFQTMGLVGKISDIETFANEESSKELPNGMTSVNPTVGNFIKFLAANPVVNTSLFMNTLWYTEPDQISQLAVTNDNLNKVRDSIYQWSVDNTYVLHCNWRSGCILSFLIFLIFILIIVAATTGNDVPASASFGKSLFGRR